MFKRKEKKYRFYSGLLLLMLIILGNCFTVLANKPAEPVKIKVAYPKQARFTETKEDGTYYGYTYDYLQEIAQFNNWEYELVPIYGDEEALEAQIRELLSSGQVDIVGSVEKPDRELDNYDYTAFNYGYVDYVLCSLAINKDISAAHLNDISSLRIASRHDTKHMQELLNFCQTNGIKADITEYANFYEMRQALEKGEVDVVATKCSNLDSSLRIVGQYSSAPLYFATKKGNTELMNRLNYSLLRIQQIDPYYERNLHQKYFDRSNKDLILSPNELEYIRDANEIYVGIETGKPFLQDIESTTGKITGISVSVMDYIQKKTGLKFVYKSYETADEMWKALDDGKIQIVSGMIYDHELAKKHNLSITRPYITAQNMRVVNKDLSGKSLVGEKLALSKDVTYDGYFEGNVQRYDTIADCIKAVETGEAGYTYLNSYTCQYLISSGLLDNIFVVPQTGWSTELSIGVTKNEDYQLFDIMEKTVNNIDYAEMQVMIYDNSAVAPPVATLRQMVENNPYPFLLIITISAVLIISALSYVVIIKHKAQNYLEIQNATYEQLSEMSNEFFFEYDMLKDTVHMSEKMADYFGLPQYIKKYSRIVAKYADDNPSLAAMADGSIEGTKEFNITLHTGDKRWLRYTVKNIRDRHGNIVKVLGKVFDITADREEKEALSKKAALDSLTQVYNSASFSQTVSEVIAQGKLGLLLIIDLDHFKNINDSLGHPAGDYVLMEVADILRSSVRKEDIVGRIGGDEFAIFLQGKVTEELVTDIYRKFKLGCSEIVYEGRPVNLTLSVGGARIRSGIDFITLYKNADSNLYAVKSAGRNGIKI